MTLTNLEFGYLFLQVYIRIRYKLAHIWKSTTGLLNRGRKCTYIWFCYSTSIFGIFERLFRISNQTRPWGSRRAVNLCVRSKDSFSAAKFLGHRRHRGCGWLNIGERYSVIDGNLLIVVIGRRTAGLIWQNFVRHSVRRNFIVGERPGLGAVGRVRADLLVEPQVVVRDRPLQDSLTCWSAAFENLI